MWYIYTMEYYSAIKSKDFMNFEGKWIEVENILNELTQLPPKHIWYVHTDKWILAQKLRRPMIQLTDHMKFHKNEGQSVHAPIPLIRETK